MSVIELKHPSVRTYERYGCRCKECSDWQRGRVARNRADRLAEGRLTHGTRSAYDAGCRCDACRSVRIEAGRLYRASRKACA